MKNVSASHGNSKKQKDIAEATAYGLNRVRSILQSDEGDIYQKQFSTKIDLTIFTEFSVSVTI